MQNKVRGNKRCLNGGWARWEEWQSIVRGAIPPLFPLQRHFTFLPHHQHHIVAQIRLFHWQWIDQFLSFKSHSFRLFLCHHPPTNPFRLIYYLIFVQKYQFPSLRNCCWPSVFFMPFYKGEYNKRKEGRRALALA